MNDVSDTKKASHCKESAPVPNVSPPKLVPDPRVIHSIDASRCRLWTFHPRTPSRVNAQSCRELSRSIAAHGQLVPALGRPTRNDPHADLEIICGSRRLFVARRLGIPLLVQVRNLNDWEAGLAAEVENKARTNLTRAEYNSRLKLLTDLASTSLSPEEVPPSDREKVFQTSRGNLLFTSRRYFNVLEFVFPQSIDEFTIELIRNVVGHFLVPRQPRRYVARPEN